MAKFVAAGIVLGAALSLAALLSAAYLSGRTTLHDEAAFLALIVVG